MEWYLEAITRELYNVGFEPLFGILHKDSDYRMSLSCDVLELLRTKADMWVLDLLDGELSAQHFVTGNGNEGVYLNGSGKQIYYRAWFKHKTSVVKNITRYVKFFRNKVEQHAKSTLSH